MNYWILSGELYSAVNRLNGRDAAAITDRTAQIHSQVKNSAITAIFAGIGIDETTLEIVCESGEFQVIADDAMQRLAEQIAKYERARVNLEHVEEKAA